MGNVTKSQPSTILSPNGNSLAVFVDGITGIIKLKDVQGNIEPLSNYNPNSLYGSFYDTTTQIALGNNTPTPMTYNTTDFSNGISIVNNSRISVSQSGIYNIQFSAQLDRVSGSGVVAIDIWLRKNGQNVANTNTKVTMTGNSNQSKIVASWNFFVSLNAGEYAELYWNTPTTNIVLLYEAENLIIPHPATPSIILTAVKI